MTIADALTRPTPGPSRDYRFPAFERLTLEQRPPRRRRAGRRNCRWSPSSHWSTPALRPIRRGKKASRCSPRVRSRRAPNGVTAPSSPNDSSDSARRWIRAQTGTARRSASPSRRERLPAALALLAEVIRDAELSRAGSRATPAGAARRAAAAAVPSRAGSRTTCSASSRTRRIRVMRCLMAALESTVGALNRGAVRAFYRRAVLAEQYDGDHCW